MHPHARCTMHSAYYTISLTTSYFLPGCEIIAILVFPTQHNTTHLGQYMAPEAFHPIFPIENQVIYNFLKKGFLSTAGLSNGISINLYLGLYRHSHDR
jgi:hypothetical protein